MLSDIDLVVNPSNSEVSNVYCYNFQSVLLAIESALPVVTVSDLESLGILGAPVDINGCRTGVHKAVERLSTMSCWLEFIDALPASFIHRNCFSMPCLLLLLGYSPCYRMHSDLTQFDVTLRQAASTVCNANYDDSRLQQSTLPVAPGGRGLSSALNMSLPAYASSMPMPPMPQSLCINATRQLVGQILHDVFESCPTSEVYSFAECWTEMGHELITMDK